MEIKHNLFTRRWLLTSQKMPERWDTARRWQQHGVLRERETLKCQKILIDLHYNGNCVVKIQYSNVVIA